MNNFVTRFVTGVLLALLFSSSVLAQSVPVQLSYGRVPTPGQWSLAFSSKQDVLGYTPLNSGGGTMTGRLWLMPSSTFNSGLNCGVGNTPTTPQNGDIWCTSSGVYAQIGGATIGPFSAGTVTSVGMSVPSIFQISGSPVTGSGTLAVSLSNESANAVFAGPASGGPAQPTFRPLVRSDQPSFNNAMTSAVQMASYGGL
jgi:hypothetical protein